MATSGAWDENNRLRREASAVIARAAQAAGARRLVQESLAFVYAEGGDAWLDEHAPLAGGGSTSTALTAEANAEELFGGDSVVLRFGLHRARQQPPPWRTSKTRAGISPSRPTRRIPADPRGSG